MDIAAKNTAPQKLAVCILRQKEFTVNQWYTKFVNGILRQKEFTINLDSSKHNQCIRTHNELLGDQKKKINNRDT